MDSRASLTHQSDYFMTRHGGVCQNKLENKLTCCGEKEIQRWKMDIIKTESS